VRRHLSLCNQSFIARKLLQLGNRLAQPVHRRIPEEQRAQQLIRIRQPSVELPMVLSLMSNGHAQVGGPQDEIRWQYDEMQPRQPERKWHAHSV
jgi:hypothetical protein